MVSWSWLGSSIQLMVEVHDLNFGDARLSLDHHLGRLTRLHNEDHVVSL
jgi:hypothetical protein